MVESTAHPYRGFIVTLCVALCIVGFVFFLSASYDPSSGRHSPPASSQLRWIGLGIAAAIGIQFIDYRKLGRFAWAFYAGLIVLLVATALFAPTIQGARRWLRFGPIALQASELMKVALVLVLARTLQHVEQGYSWRGLAVPVGVVLLPVAFVIRQPDLGMCLLYTPIIGVMLWASGVHRRVLLTLVLLVAVLAPVGYVWGLKDYQRDRIRTFVAWDEAGEGKADLYQPLNARIAVANGGLIGMGLFRGHQNTGGYLPAKHNDYIFAIIAEETGLAGAVVLLGLYFLLVALLFAGAIEHRDPFGRLILVGIGGLIGTQVLVNTAVASGALPTTGLTLPLISHGGSSMLTTCVLFGLAINVLSRRPITVARPRF